MALTPGRPPRVDVRIDALVLDGVSPGDPRVAHAVEQATGRALAAHPRAAAHARRAGIGAAVGSALTRTGGATRPATGARPTDGGS
jgi:hypothetical protein